MEPRRNRPELSADARRALLERLVSAEVFEQFLQARYPGQKRFSLEGGEGLVTLLDELVEESGRLDVAEMVFGMAHRGRINVLAHLLEKPYEMIFAEFEGAPLPDDILGDGDVKYHLGYSHDHRTRSGADVHLSLASNPSRPIATIARVVASRRCSCTVTPPSWARASSTRRSRSRRCRDSRRVGRST
jgi:2-oxoglutarate dehydrogenase E1 component